MMRTSAALGDQLVADAPREGKIGDAVAVEMAELASAEPELDAAEAVRRGLHTRPRLHDRGYLFTCFHGSHTRCHAWR
jgi:hypothetical protein